MSVVRVAAVAENFGRDLTDCYARIERLVGQARERAVDLLVLPEATLGGYLASLQADDAPELPPAFDVHGPEVTRLAQIAGDLVLTLGLCELAPDGTRYNTAVAVSGDGLLGTHRKVHQPLGEGTFYAAGDRFEAFDTPVGRLGMMICYDKAFPESARSLAVDGAELIACLSAWPGSRTNAAVELAEDRWLHRFDLFDRARALENQVVWISSNQSGTFGSLRFVASAKIVGPGGDVLATTGLDAGMATADLDLARSLGDARRSMFHLRDRRADSYDTTGALADAG